MAYTYSTFVTALAGILVVDETDAEFVALLPTFISDAENRIYRDLDLLSTVISDTSASLTPNSRAFTLPTASGRFVNVKQINIFTGTYPEGRSTLLPVSRSILDHAYPSETGVVGVYPQYYAPLTDQSFIITPAPAVSHTVEVLGTIRPTPLSSTNTTSFLTNYIPDLFLAASICSATGGLLKNYGALASDPQMAVSWEGKYAAILGNAKPEELRRKFAFGGQPQI